MKTLKWFLLACMVLGYGIASAQNLPEVIAFEEIKFNKGVNKTEFINYIKSEGELEKKYGRGISDFEVMIGDRGDRIGKYSLYWGFDFKAARDYYFPQEVATSYPRFTALLRDIGMKDIVDNSDYIDRLYTHTDYEVIGFDQFTDPKLGQVFGLHRIKVKPGQEKAFEKFVIDTYYPAIENKFPGVAVYILKGDRGTYKNKYAVLVVTDKVSRRDSYWPKNGTSSEEYLKLAKPLTGIINQYDSYLISPSDTANSTDYVMLNR